MTTQCDDTTNLEGRRRESSDKRRRLLAKRRPKRKLAGSDADQAREEIEALAQQFMQPGPLSNDDRRQKPLKLPDIKDATRAPVYHVTSTLQLPWIVESGELRPYPTRDNGIGDTVFLWGSAKRSGDKTGYAARMAQAKEVAWREDLFRPVRFTLPAEGFLTWNEIVLRQGWTDDQVAALVAYDRKHHDEDGHDQWHCRADPLPLADVLRAEARTYSGRWRTNDLDPGRIVRTGDPNRMGYRIGRRKILYAVRELLGTIDGVPIYSYRSPYLDSEEYAEAAYEARRKAEEEDDTDRFWD
jgi:hypothetical protein